MLRNILHRIALNSPKYINRKCSTKVNKYHVCIVGSGPAGFYTAQQILKHPSAVVDIYEKQSVPFGLVRFGVAPDHPEVKNVINTFTKTASNERCHFYGNVRIGKDISLNDLRTAYHSIILSYGAENDMLLGIPGEDLPNVISARKFVGWYNGLPENSSLSVNLNCDTAVIIGQGNVALDVARMLLTPPDILKETDITQHALDALYNSKIKKVILIGRRGPLQVAFTIKEFREMTKLPKCHPVLSREDFEPFRDIVPSLPRPRQRLTDLMIKTAMSMSDNLDKQNLEPEDTKQWELKFLRSPLKIIPANDRSGIKSIVFSINKLEGSGDEAKYIKTEETETLDCGLILRSVGYRSLQIDPDLPFDKNKGIVPNENGRVCGIQGLYCSGWLKTGPKGVILHTMADSFETGKLVIQDLESSPASSEFKAGSEKILSILQSKDIIPVTFNGWKKIDEVEQERGNKIKKPREKMLNTSEMISVATDKL